MNNYISLPLFEDIEANPSHPAKYTKSLFSAIVPMLKGCNRIADPFGGTGRLSLLLAWYPNAEIFPVELEPKWARISKHTIPGNALYLPFANHSMDAICTSPTYGNRMADKKSKNGKRMTYADSLGRDLHPDNSGALQWGNEYRAFHVKAWEECRRILKPAGIFVLNIKDHIRNGEIQEVTKWHVETLISMGFEWKITRTINTPSMRRGANAEKRIEYESVIGFIRS